MEKVQETIPEESEAEAAAEANDAAPTKEVDTEVEASQPTEVEA